MYDNEFEELDDELEGESLEETTHIMFEDKILNNSFNTGEIEYQEFNFPMKVDDRVAGQYKSELSENIIEVHVLKMLEDNIYALFLNSKYYEKYKNPKKVDKSDMIKMYYFFKDDLQKQNSYSAVEIFIGFAEFFQVNYEQLYGEVSVKDKENLLKELHNSYGLTSKIKTKKLF